ncbi:UNVERIFIED_CONTAM: putative disease resistance RPP8-like protein 2 [Sesamum calycinum]|uniref:Disease resistance RPP8-like protein 2 n=1 Tax=Sesamum calycinum TaxID=2727403 RepID=A0AAW2IVA3_9LAMI
MALETLRELLIEEAKFLSSVSGEVEDVRRQLNDMHCFLKDADGGGIDTIQRRSRIGLLNFAICPFKLRMRIEQLESLLTTDDKSKGAISICGMGGLGKTTLAAKIYNGEAVQRCFKYRAWVCVSQQFQPKTIFQRLLKQLLPNEAKERDEDALVRKLCDVQKNRKCLIVLDDVWEVDHWNSLRHAFPIGEADSKVLLTTRNQNIAPAEYVHHLKCLSEGEGWELLQKIALPNNYSQGMISLEDRGRGESLRDVAERYLFELANKKEEGFVEVVDRQMGRADESSICKTSRLAIHLDELDDDHIHNIGKNKNLRSLLFLQKRWQYRDWNHMEGLNFGMFKFMKILVLEGYGFKNGQLPKGVGKLILLKLLSIKGSLVEELPVSVCKLPYLQSLNLQVREHIKLPNFIHKMRSLRHLYLPRISFTIGGENLKLGGLNELETLIDFDSSKGDITNLLNMPKLRVLEGRIWDEESLSMIIDHILNHQDQFRDIKLLIQRTCNVNQEKDGSTLLRRPMEILEKLPVLRNLGLLNDAYVGREMVCRATGFPQLKHLEFAEFSGWRVEKGAMPTLLCLYIGKCSKLEMIPDGLKFITTLSELDIAGMPKEFREEGRSGGW